MGILNRLFGGSHDEEYTTEDFANELTQHLAEEFSDDPDVQIYAPMNTEQTIEFLEALRNGQVSFDEPEKDNRPWWKIW